MVHGHLVYNSKTQSIHKIRKSALEKSSLIKYVLPNSIKASLLSRMSMHFLLKTTYTNTHNALIIIQTLSYMNDCNFNNSKIASWQLFCNYMWQKYCYLYNYCLKQICSYHFFLILATHKGNEQFHNCPWYHL